MHLTLIKNTDESQIIVHKIARIVLFETGASSLTAVEAMTSMIKNLSVVSGRELSDILSDKNIFKGSSNADANDSKFQMCVRVARKMLNGDLSDGVSGATKFHHINQMPEWAMSRGYIAEIDDLLFYI